MALFLEKKYDNGDTLLGIWHVEESFNELRSILNEDVNDIDPSVSRYEDFSSEKRKKEWICTRLLLKTLLKKNDKIIYDEFGKPSLESKEFNISITHSNEYVAILITKKANAGIDIEKISDKIAKVAMKFLHLSEIDLIDEKNRVLHLYIHWCAKEALYKIHGKRDISFVKNMKIEAFTPDTFGELTGNIMLGNIEDEFLLHYFIMNEYVLVWCTK